jgi:non-ribosomal peptide synthase protein (TIGR01720 family)
VTRIRELAPRLHVFNHYGPSETTVGVLTHQLPDAPLASGQPVPLGRPLASARSYVLDPAGALTPDRVPGELYLGGGTLALGYPGRPAETAERFLPDPFGTEPGARMYRTGDRGVHDADGRIVFLGRTDDQLSLHGVRIEPAEIEAALRRLDGVRDAAVLAHPADRTESQLVAYLAADRDDTDVWRTRLREELPQVMIPARFVRMDALPRSANLKLDRTALPDPDAAAAAAHPFEAPTTPVEIRLAELWQQVLRVPRVSVADDFFALGGDSILSLQIIARARQSGLAFTPRQIFENPSIRALAPLVRELATAAPARVSDAGPVPLLPIQHWFFALDPAERHHWNQSAYLEIPARIESAALREAFARAIARHAALRTRFAPAERGWTATVRAAGEPQPGFLDTLELAPGDEAAERAALEVAQRSLDLEHGPLLRVLHVRRGADRPARLLIAVHHLAMDVVSWRLLLDEVAAAILGTPPPAAPALGAGDWARQLETWGRTGAFEDELAHWLERPAFALPQDWTGPNTVGTAAHVQVTLDPASTRALLEELPGQQRTRTDDIVLCALGRTLARFADSPHALIECESHGRESPDPALDLSRTLGWLTVRWPLVLRGLASEPDPLQRLRETRHALRTVPNGGLGYAVLRHCSAHARALAELPVPTVSYNNLGQGSRGLAEIPGVQAAPEPGGSPRSLAGQRACLIDVTAHAAGGRLQLRWTYATRVHRRDTIERLALETLQEIEALIAAASAQGSSLLVPADLPGARLDEASLADLLAEVGDL